MIENITNNLKTRFDDFKQLFNKVTLEDFIN